VFDVATGEMAVAGALLRRGTGESTDIYRQVFVTIPVRSGL
jgi:hypothetical protein